jgi:hypothetical protein
MNHDHTPADMADVPWPTSSTRVAVPDTSMLPGSEHAPLAAVGMLNTAVRSAHDSIDRLASSAAPAVQHMGERVEAASSTLHKQGEQLRQTRDQWTQGARLAVREHPLAAVAGALLLGALVARLTR